jgi:O-antigen ligase
MLGNATVTFTTIRAGQILLSDVFFLLAAAAILVKLLIGDTRDLAPAASRRGSPLILAGALLLIAGGALSSLRSWTPVESITVVLRFAWITLVWFWIMRTVCRDREDLSRLLRAWKASALISSVFAILGLMGIAFVSDVNGDRQTALAGHPNHLAAHLVATLPLFLLAVPRRREHLNRQDRIRWIVALGLCTTAIFSTGSMTALLSSAAMIVVVSAVSVARNRPTRPRRGAQTPLAPIAVILLLGTGLALLATSDLPAVDRLTRFREGDSYVTESVGSRGERNALVTEHFDEYLVVGLGLTNYSGPNLSVDADDEANRNYGVHNMYLGLLYQAGLPATFGVVLVLATAGRQISGLLRRADFETHLLAMGLLGAFVTVNVMSLFQPISFDRFFWMPIALTGCLWSIRRRELAAAPPATWPGPPTGAPGRAG